MDLGAVVRLELGGARQHEPVAVFSRRGGQCSDQKRLMAVADQAA